MTAMEDICNYIAEVLRVRAPDGLPRQASLSTTRISTASWVSLAIKDLLEPALDQHDSDEDRALRYVLPDYVPIPKTSSHITEIRGQAAISRSSLLTRVRRELRGAITVGDIKCEIVGEIGG